MNAKIGVCKASMREVYHVCVCAKRACEECIMCVCVQSEHADTLLMYVAYEKCFKYVATLYNICVLGLLIRCGLSCDVIAVPCSVLHCVAEVFCIVMNCVAVV